MLPADSPTAPQVGSAELERRKQQVSRTLQSATFRNSTTLQQLLQYLTARALDGGTEPLKEYTIGVEAFGRPQDFDPKTDTIVRVQIHRLRQKLKEYYDTDGKGDPILIEIPKGHYLPSFESVAEGPSRAHEVAPPQLQTSVAASAGTAEVDAEEVNAESRTIRSSRYLKTGALAAAVVAVLGLALFFWPGGLFWSARGSASYASDPVKAFWVSFLGNDSAPVIGYPDAQFLLDDSNDLFSYPQGASDDRGAPVDEHLARQFASNPELVSKAGQLYYENGYTGAGELQGIALLSGLFGRMGVVPTIKPSRDITPSDLMNHNVILLGSSFQNVAVAQLITSGDFNFNSPDLRANPDLRQQQWRSQILNSAPQANERAAYRTERNPETQVLTADYSLISVQADEMSGRHIAVLGGLDTTGTQGAVMFATSKLGVEQLSKALSVLASTGSKGEIPPFQALLRVRLERGNRVLDSSLLAVHKLSLSSSRGTSANAPSGASH